MGSAHGITNQLVNGWELAGIVTLRSGLPFTPSISSDTANTGVASQRPDVIETPVTVGNLACWFYTSANSSCTSLVSNGKDAFAVPRAMLRYGTGGRNILRADGLKQVDFTLSSGPRCSTCSTTRPSPPPRRPSTLPPEVRKAQR